MLIAPLQHAAATVVAVLTIVLPGVIPVATATAVIVQVPAADLLHQAVAAAVDQEDVNLTSN